nr:hypothetical protein [Tanacetum cinerariifolium]
TASWVIEMDEPAVATDSSGVPLAIEKSPLDFADEAGASGQETAAPEVSLPEEVPITTLPGGDQAAPVVVEPHPVQESRKRGREGIDANAPPKSLRRDHADLQPSGVPADVSGPDPLAFADAASPPPADVIRSSQGVAAAGDPGSENVSSSTVVGSSGSVPAGGDGFLIAPEVSGEETLKAAFEDYKRQQDQMVEQRCAEMDVRLDAISAFADVVSAGISKGMSEGLKHGVEHGHAQRTVESLEAYDPEAEAKFAAALQSLKDLKLPLLDQLEGLKDASMDVIMASLYLEGDTGGDAPQFIRDLRPSSSQLAIPVYPEPYGHGVRGRWGCNPLMRRTMYLVRYVGILISMGINASVPYVREKGVSSWLDLIIILWTQRTWGSSSTQFLFPSPKRALMPSPRLLFALSTSPLDCGCLTDAKCCVIFSLSHQSLNVLSANCLPLSEIISPGMPKRHTMLSHTNFFTCPP